MRDLSRERTQSERDREGQHITSPGWIHLRWRCGAGFSTKEIPLETGTYVTWRQPITQRLRQQFAKASSVHAHVTRTIKETTHTKDKETKRKEILILDYDFIRIFRTIKEWHTRSTTGLAFRDSHWQESKPQKTDIFLSSHCSEDVDNGLRSSR